MSTIPALTVWQPWATLIMVGAKPYEFRGWPPPKRLVGRPLGIHAGARPVRPSELRDLIRAIELAVSTGRGFGSLVADIAIPILARTLRREVDLPLSHMLGTARVAGVATPAEIADAVGAAPNDSNRDEHFNYGWRLDDLRPLEPPVPARGAQGVWLWSGA